MKTRIFILFCLHSYVFAQKYDNTWPMGLGGRVDGKYHGGMNIWCNEHLDNTRAWNINPQTPGAFPDQGQCNAFFNLTPENKFFDACTNPVNHIISTVSFDYWINGGESDPPDCNSSNIDDQPCSFGNPESGCDQSIELTSGNVNDYLVDVPNMPDGPQRQLLVNDLIRYFIGIGDDETVFDLLSNEVNEDYKMDYAILLLEAGNISLAQSVVSSLPATSSEAPSFSEYFDVLVFAKNNNLSLHNLPQSRVVELEEIADLRTKAGYMAQAVLSNYYDKEYLSILETDNGLEFRTKKENAPIKSNKLLIFPNPVDDNLTIITHSKIDEIVNIKIKAVDGKVVSQLTAKNDNEGIKLNCSNFKTGVYFIEVSHNDKFLGVYRFLKN